MVQAAYANNASTIFQARFDRYINDVLSAPMRPWQMTLGYTVGGLVRALAIGVLAARAGGGPGGRAGRAAVRPDRWRSRSGSSCSRRSGSWSASTPRPGTTPPSSQNIVILPLAFVGGVFYSVDVLPVPLARAVARQPDLLPRERRALRLPRRERRVDLALARRDRRARDARLRVGPVAVHDRPEAEGLSRARLAEQPAQSGACVACRALPAPRRVARAGRAREAGRLPRTRTTGAGRCPGFGDPDARVYVLGLAPAAHGGNRTGRVFTGDRSGDWLFASLHRTGFANQPDVGRAGRRPRASTAPSWPRPCAARRPPTSRCPSERDNCLPYAAEELRADAAGA